jgi:hypothetical protein
MPKPKLIVPLAIALVTLVAAGWWAALRRMTPTVSTEMIAYSVVRSTAGASAIALHLGRGGVDFGPEQIKGPEPVSMSAPSLAKKNKASGNVETMLRVDASGSVAGVTEMYSTNVGNAEVVNNLLHVAHTWKFKPATEQGKPVAAMVIVQTRF